MGMFVGAGIISAGHFEPCTHESADRQLRSNEVD